MKDKENKKFWDSIAFVYATFMKKNNGVYIKICSTISEYLNKDMSVLELACGTGQITSLLSNKVQSWEATDFSEKMIEVSKKRFAEENILFSVQDATNLPYNDDTFDAVIIANALHIMPNPEKALAEIHRVLKPKGMLFAPTFVYDIEKEPKLKLFFMENLGFHTYHKWNKSEFSHFVQQNKFNVLQESIIKDGLLYECMLVCNKM